MAARIEGQQVCDLDSTTTLFADKADGPKNVLKAMALPNVMKLHFGLRIVLVSRFDEKRHSIGVCFFTNHAIRKDHVHDHIEAKRIWSHSSQAVAAALGNS